MSWCIHRSLVLSSLLVVVVFAACNDEVAAPGAPQVINQEVTTDEDTPVVIDALKDGGDPEGAPLTVIVANVPDQGIELINRTMIKVTPKPDFNGTFTVSYTVSNARLSTFAHTTVTVRPVNDAPVATGGTVKIGPRAQFTLGGAMSTATRWPTRS